MMKVKIIMATGTTALVEWYDGTLHRCFLPAAAIHGDQASEADLQAGIPYGVAWEAMPVTITAEAIANELRRVGIWTMGDLEKQPNVAAAAVGRAIGVYLASLRREAIEQTRGEVRDE